MGPPAPLPPAGHAGGTVWPSERRRRQRRRRLLAADEAGCRFCGHRAADTPSSVPIIPGGCSAAAAAASIFTTFRPPSLASANRLARRGRPAQPPPPPRPAARPPPPPPRPNRRQMGGEREGLGGRGRRRPEGHPRPLCQGCAPQLGPDGPPRARLGRVSRPSAWRPPPPPSALCGTFSEL